MSVVEPHPHADEEKPKSPEPIPDLPDPIHQINASDRALESLAAEERRVRDELAVKDPLESTADTIAAATQLLLLIQAIDKIKQERDAAIRRLARGY
jgi:hypothetical protein